MLGRYDIIKFLSDHLSSLKDEYNISRIGLFGSFARNEQNDSSDIDIILEFKEGTENIYEKKKQTQRIFNQSFSARCWFVPRKIYEALRERLSKKWNNLCLKRTNLASFAKKQYKTKLEQVDYDDSKRRNFQK